MRVPQTDLLPRLAIAPTAVTLRAAMTSVDSSFYDFEVTTLQGRRHRLDDYRGKVVLVVNTASKCGFTPQYAGLEALYRKYGDQGLVILGFPSNQFGAQEPGSADEIETFCQANYGVSFPIHEKGDVNGKSEQPLWAWLKQEAPGLLGTQAIKWNFTKFLIDRRGVVVERFAPTTTPEAIAPRIEALLAT